MLVVITVSRSHMVVDNDLLEMRKQSDQPASDYGFEVIYLCFSERIKSNVGQCQLVIKAEPRPPNRSR